jgi:hypothetical protein
MLLAGELPAARIVVRAAPDLGDLGWLAEAAAPAEDLRPLYLRAPDAKPMAP